MFNHDSASFASILMSSSQASLGPTKLDNFLKAPGNLNLDLIYLDKETDICIEFATNLCSQSVLILPVLQNLRFYSV